MRLSKYVAAAVLLSAAIVSGQQQKPADAVPDSGAVIRTETRVVLVDTVVTDKKGNYVRNLTAKDFKVWEDNKEQLIKTFTFQSDPAAPTSSQRRYIVLFFDNSTMDFGAQAQARQAAAKFIESNAGPNRMMSIVNFGGALQIAQNFTDNTDRLKRVVSGEKMAAVTPNGDPAMGQLSKAAADFGARDMLLALRSLAKNLNTVPGRKTLILFTGGFPLTAERISETTATIDMCNRSNVAIYPIDVRGLVSGAPLADVMEPSSKRPRLWLGFLASPGSFSPGMSFFQRGGSVGTGGGGAGAGAGSRGTGTTGAAPSPGAGRGASPTAGPAPAPTTGRGGGVAPNPGMNGRLNNMNTLPPSQSRNIMIPKMPEGPVDNQNVMHMLADGTGGFVIKNTNDLLAGLEKIGKEMDEYYVLGYTPPESTEGSCHALKVKVDQGGTSVRSRSGYCNAKPRDLLAGNPVEKTLENRAAGTQAGTVAASMQLPYFYTAGNVARVNVAMEIPADAIKFEKQKGKFHGEMDVLGIAYNADGSAAARFSDTVKEDFEDKKQVEAFQKAPFHYENEFDVAAGKYNLKVVFSAGGASFGKLEAPLSIEPWDSAQFGLSGLALSKQIRQQTDMASTLDASLLEDRVPLITQGVQVIPAGSTTFSKGGPALFYAEVYVPQLLTASADSKPVVGIQIRILDRKTKEQKFTTGLMRLDMPDKGNNPTIPIAERMPLDNVGPGQYIVELQAVDSTNKLLTRTADFDLQ
jgi:VWFA-related protein